MSDRSPSEIAEIHRQLQILWKKMHKGPVVPDPVKTVLYSRMRGRLPVAEQKDWPRVRFLPMEELITDGSRWHEQIEAFVHKVVEAEQEGEKNGVGRVFSDLCDDDLRVPRVDLVHLEDRLQLELVVPVTTIERRYAAALKRVEPLGFKPYGAVDRCIYSGLLAEEIDHVPSVHHVNQMQKRGTAYGGKRLLVVSLRTINRALAHYEADCLIRRAAKAYVTLKRRRADTSQIRDRIRFTAAMLSCPCVSCCERPVRFDEALQLDEVRARLPSTRKPKAAK